MIGRLCACPVSDAAFIGDPPKSNALVPMLTMQSNNERNGTMSRRTMMTRAGLWLLVALMVFPVASEDAQGVDEEAQAWVDAFVEWYNTVHLHSGIKFVTPEDRHAGRDVEILQNRRRVYEHAKTLHPERWSGEIRDWTPIAAVVLNPDSTKAIEVTNKELAA